MFSERLKLLRNQAGMSQKELASHLFVSQQSVAKWEMDKSTPNPEMIVRISELFKVSSDYLLGRTNSISSEYSANKKEGRQDAPLDDMDIEMLNRFSSLPEVVKQHVLQYLDLLSNGMIVSGGAQLSEAQQEILRSRTEETPEDHNIDSHKDAG